jgi:opacity protein-like surface antigen
MNKKVLVVVLVLVLAVGSVFAAKSDMKVGAQLGYGGRTVIENAKDGDVYKLFNNGFYGAFTFEYGITNAISVKAEAGINTMGTLIEKYNDEDPEPWDSTPVNFTFFAGAFYNYAINKEITVYGGAGFDMLIGNFEKESTNKADVGFGLGLEAGASYKINNQISVNAGGKFAWHFVNTRNYNFYDSDSKISQLTYKAYAGVTYSL